MIGPVGVGAAVEELGIVADAVLEIASVAGPVTVGTAEEEETSEALY